MSESIIHPSNYRETSAPEPRMQAIRTGVETMNLHPEPGEPDPCPEQQGIGHDSRQCLVCATRDAWVRRRAAEKLRELQVGDGADVPGSTWQPQSVADVVEALISGTARSEEPTVGRIHSPDGRADKALLYQGRVNGIAGESGSGKSWTALAVTGQEIDAGEAVIYIDFEDTANGIVGRLLAAGADHEAVVEQLTYLSPAERLDSASWSVLTAILHQKHPTLVVIDSTGEALSVEGVNPNADDEVARWFRSMPRRISRHECRPAVLVLDHIPKADDGALWPIGSQRKRAAIDGAQYMQRNRKAFAKGVGGEARLKVAKDRHGTYITGREVAALIVTPDQEKVDGAGSDEQQGHTLALVDLDDRNVTNATPFRRTVLMERVSRYLELQPGPAERTARQVRQRVDGKEQAVLRAADLLVEEGYAKTEAGPRGATVYSILKPFRESENGGHQS